MAKKLKNESGLLREALSMIMDDATRRGVAEFEPGDSHNLKIEYAYRLLIHDKEIAPLPPDQATLPNIRHRLAKWVTHKLPADHELLK
jgi:VIT1/CCC1 family predicted Fe2+/Mn2+ transporter